MTRLLIFSTINFNFTLKCYLIINVYCSVQDYMIDKDVRVSFRQGIAGDPYIHPAQVV